MATGGETGRREEEEEEEIISQIDLIDITQTSCELCSNRPLNNDSDEEKCFSNGPVSNDISCAATLSNDQSIYSTTNYSDYQSIYPTRPTTNPLECHQVYSVRPTNTPPECQNISSTRPITSEYENIYSTRPTTTPSEYQSIYSTRPATTPSEYQSIYSTRPATTPSEYQNIYSTRPAHPTDRSTPHPNYSTQKGSYSNQSTNRTSRHINYSTRQANRITRALGQCEKKVVTAGNKSKIVVDETADKSDAETPDRNIRSQNQEYRCGPVWSWNDHLLKEKEKIVGESKKRKTFLWRPGSGRHVDEGPGSYRPFTHVCRVLHVDDALDVLLTQRIKPKSVFAFSCINSRELPPDHPCTRLKVLWFGAKLKDVEESRSSWYGNVQFMLDAHLLVTQWKHWFLVEMMTTATHTASRILVTNSDYSSVLPTYNYRIAGGPWRVTAEGHKGLIKCSRYKFRGTNVHNHELEFMIEAKPEDESAILAASQISFVNHEKARHGYIPHVCSRYQKEKKPCPTPFSACQAARYLFRMLKQRSVQWSTLLPKLSPEAQQELEWFNEDERRTAMQSQAKR